MALKLKSIPSTGVVPTRAASIRVSSTVVKRSRTVYWSVPYASDLWSRLKKRGRVVSHAPATSGSDHVHVGPVLVAGTKGLALLTVDHDKKNNEIDCILTLRTKPNQPPPAEIVRADRRAGGNAGLHMFVEQCCALATSKQASHILEFSLPKKHWSCRILPRKASDRDELLGTLGNAVTVDAIGCEIDNGVLGLDEVTVVYSRAAEEFQVFATAQIPISIEGVRFKAPLMDEVESYLIGQLFEGAKR